MCSSFPTTDICNAVTLLAENSGSTWSTFMIKLIKCNKYDSDKMQQNHANWNARLNRKERFMNSIFKFGNSTILSNQSRSSKNWKSKPIRSYFTIHLVKKYTCCRAEKQKHHSWEGLQLKTDRLQFHKACPQVLENIPPKIAPRPIIQNH